MLPPPLTSAISSPSARTPTSSRASRSTVSSSRPYSRGPIRASPDSFSRTRRNAAGACLEAGAANSADRVPGVVEQLDAALPEHVADRGGRLVRAVPGLLHQHRLAVEALVEHALDDLLTHVLGLALHLVGALEDLALGLDQLRRHLVAAAVGGLREREVQGEAARRGRVAALRPHEGADLVGRCVRVRRERLAVAGRHPLRPDHLDVLAELRGELHPPLLEAGGGLLAALVHGAQDVLCVREELLVVRDRLRLAADT